LGVADRDRAAEPRRGASGTTLVAAQIRHLGLTSTACVTFHVAISQVDSRFARVSETFHPPFPSGCVASNGQSLYERMPAGWRDLGDASVPFPCGYRTASARVVRSLFGSCGFKE